LLETAASILQASLNLCAKWNGAGGGRLGYVFTPRFAGSCSFELMREVGRIAKENHALIQSHLSENQDEVKWVRSLFTDQPSYTEVYAAAGLLGERTIMAHCIHLSDSEISTLAASRTNVAFCPYSNRTLRSGTMAYEKLQRAGLRIGLGTDIAGGPSLSMFRQMGEALNSAGVLSPEGALYLATMGGAQVLGLADRIGNFERGKDADFIVVDYRKTDPLSGSGPCNEPQHILSRLCYNGDAYCVKEVYSSGRRLM
jgi:guanine deaminase